MFFSKDVFKEAWFVENVPKSLHKKIDNVIPYPSKLLPKNWTIYNSVSYCINWKWIYVFSFCKIIRVTPAQLIKHSDYSEHFRCVHSNHWCSIPLHMQHIVWSLESIGGHWWPQCFHDGQSICYIFRWWWLWQGFCGGRGEAKVRGVEREESRGFLKCFG